MRPFRALVTGMTVCGVIAASGQVLRGQDVLQYHWAKGDQLRYRTVQETNVTMSGIPGMDDMTLGTTITQVQQLIASDIAADGAATMTVRYESIRMQLSSPAETLVYDSAAPPDASADPTLADMSKVMGSLIGESFTIVMAPDGAVRSVDGASRLLEKMQANASPATAASLGGLSSMMSDDAIRSSFGQSFGVLPEKAVAVGDTWQRHLTVPNPLGAMTVSSTLTMKGTDTVNGRSLTRIAVAQSIKTAPGGAIGPMTVEVGDATGDGEILFDHHQGRMVRAVGHVTLPMTMSMTAPDGSAISLNGLSKTTVTTELVER